MAIIALQSASSALTALNTALDVTSNNLANVNTTGFRSSRVNFQDLLYLERAQPGSESNSGEKRPIGLYVGLGVKAVGTQLNFTQGSEVATGNALDVTIEGNGFFVLQAPNSTYPGQKLFTRAGHFTQNKDGDLVMADSDGKRLNSSTITIPANATDITITSDGKVLYTQPGQQQQTEAGQISIATFINPAGLQQVGGTMFAETAASGEPQEGIPGTDNRGKLLSGYLEASNVDPTKELIELIKTQRAFEMNSQSIRAADETLRTVAQLSR